MIKKNWISFITIIRREVSRVIRIWPQTILPPVIIIFLYFFIFGDLIGGRIGKVSGYTYIEYIMPGLIMMSVITSSYTNVVSSFFGAKFQNHIEELLVSPTHDFVIILGFIFGGICRGVIVGFCVFIIASLFIKLYIFKIALSFIVIILTSILFSLTGLLNGIFAKKFDDIAIVPTFILSPLTYLGGVFYSVDLLPLFWKKITHLNPIFYMVNAFRYSMIGCSDVDINLSILIIFSFIFILFSVNIYLIGKGRRLRI